MINNRKQIILGAIGGDIFGSIYEFNNHKTFDFNLFSDNCNITDDTVLSIAIADSLLNNCDFKSTLLFYGRKYRSYTYGSTRLILASTKPNAWILDPFAGSSTTGIAANLLNRRYLGIDQEDEFLEISKNRKLEIENPKTAELFRHKIQGFTNKKELDLFLAKEPTEEYGSELIL